MTKIGPFKAKSTISTATSGAVGRARDAQPKTLNVLRGGLSHTFSRFYFSSLQVVG